MDKISKEKMKVKLHSLPYEIFFDIQKILGKPNKPEHIKKRKLIEHEYGPVFSYMEKFPDLELSDKQNAEFEKKIDRILDEGELQIKALEKILGGFAMFLETVSNPYATDYSKKEAFNNILTQAEESFKELEEKTIENENFN